MNPSNVSDPLPAGQRLNAVGLQNAVLCAECDVVSDSPHDVCLVCGTHSLINICQILGWQDAETSVRTGGSRAGENHTGSCAAFPEASSGS
jgi:hypothetical protein